MFERREALRGMLADWPDFPPGAGDKTGAPAASLPTAPPHTSSPRPPHRRHSCHWRPDPDSRHAPVWYDHSYDALALTNLFGGRPPDNPVELHGVYLHRDGPLVRLEFDLPTFPERPHRRWVEGANTLQVALDFVGASGFEQN